MEPVQVVWAGVLALGLNSPDDASGMVSGRRSFDSSPDETGVGGHEWSLKARLFYRLKTSRYN